MKLTGNLREAFQVMGDLACMGSLVDDTPSMIVKAPADDIEKWRGQRPIGNRFVLSRADAGAVIAWWATISEIGGSRFRLETTLNPAGDHDRPILSQLAKSKEIHFHFFDPSLVYTFSKEVRHKRKQRDQVRRFIRMAMRHNERVGDVDFPRAKAEFFERSEHGS